MITLLVAAGSGWAGQSEPERQCIEGIGEPLFITDGDHTVDCAIAVFLGDTDAFDFAASGGEEIRISLTKFRGLDLVDARVYADNGSEHVATKKGICVHVNTLPRLIDGLQQAEAAARRDRPRDPRRRGP